MRRVDQISSSGNVSYRWWPESWVINWGPGINHSRLYDYDKVLQNTDTGGTFNVEFAKQTTFSANVHKLMERYRGIEFDKTQYGFSGSVNMNRKILFTGSVNSGDEIRFIANPWLGASRAYSAHDYVPAVVPTAIGAEIDDQPARDPRCRCRNRRQNRADRRRLYQFTLPASRPEHHRI